MGNRKANGSGSGGKSAKKANIEAGTMENGGDAERIIVKK